jgi:hypothetical protein
MYVRLGPPDPVGRDPARVICACLVWQARPNHPHFSRTCPVAGNTQSALVHIVSTKRCRYEGPSSATELEISSSPTWLQFSSHQV